MLEELATQAFWVGLLKIIGVNIILSGDNAVVIALAARSLPARQQKQAVIWGSLAAIVMRVVLIRVLVVMLDRVVEAPPDPEREHPGTEHGTDQQREQKLHHGSGLAPQRARGRALPRIGREPPVGRPSRTGGPVVAGGGSGPSSGRLPPSPAGRRELHGSVPPTR